MKVTRFMMMLICVLQAGCLQARNEASMLLRVDREFAGPPLKSIRPPIRGRLTEDGEMACRELPYSACGYDDGNGYDFYFSDGRLVVKEFFFSRTNRRGRAPFGIRNGATTEDIRRVARNRIGREGTCIFSETPRVCYVPLDRNTRVDFIFNDSGSIERIRLSVTDFV